MTGQNLLVSIIVITYNSSKYVLETLESARAQTYQNIELIVSDDCSTDNTVEICREWIEENKERFVRTRLITTPANTGIPANCNRGVRAAQGEWVKLIAGDDALMENGIEELICICIENPSIEIFMSYIETFNDSFEKENLINIRPANGENLTIYSKNATSKLQLEHILNGGYHNSPGLFIKRKIYEEIDYYDEQYKLIEDIPFYLKLALNDKKIEFAPIVTVRYRKSKYNLTNTLDQIIPSYSVHLSRAIYNASKNYGKMKYIINSYWNKMFVSVIMLLGNKSYICHIVNLIRIKLQPIRYYSFMNKIKNLTSQN